MRKLSILLVFLLLFGMALPVHAEETTVRLSISTAEEFLAFAENCRLDTYSQNLNVSLEKDIDLSGVSFESVPIFSGSFDGKGHIISGLSITADGSVKGLFRYLTSTAVVQNLTIKGDIHPGGSRNEVGTIAGQNEGKIINCGFVGSLSGADYVGGIVGMNGVTGVIEYCIVNGEIHGDHFVGGIAGENFGVIRGCFNYAKINTTPQQNDVEISDITMDTLTNTEAANTVTDIGGIAGISSGVIRDCKNYGDIGYQHIGYNIGGIAGTQSGYIAGCESRGDIQGRKEVGGIVGQMEPTTVIEYSEDTLQILQVQLGELSGLVNKASGNAQANASQIRGQIGVLQEQTQTAQGAVDSLLPDQISPELPDADATVAALNTLSSTLNAMPGTLRSITAATQTTVSSLSRDLNAIGGKISSMEDTINNASENLGASIQDVSDQDTAELLTGKVENCINYGNLLADLNVGGIAGAMVMENDLDVLEDWDQYGEESLNFQSQLCAVVLNCANQGIVTGKKQNAGGIVGWQALGLVKASTNAGKLNCVDADYVGGISGLSTGYIRYNYVKCEIAAQTYVGGIAGSATIATDCLSQVKFVGSKEKAGAILGYAEKNEEENSISGNYYLSIERDLGAIDGISYSGMAEQMELDSFLAQENLPAIFKTVTVRFLFDNGKTSDISVQLGNSLNKSQIPAVPKKDGHTGKWDGLEFAELEQILFDKTFKAVYTPYSSVVESKQTRENDLPILLLEGLFTDRVGVEVIQSDEVPILEKNEILLESWQITADDNGSTARFLLPVGVDAGNVKLMLCNEVGQWREVAFSQNESYLVFSLQAEDRYLALVEVHSNDMIWLITGLGVAALISICIVLIVQKKKAKKKNLAETEEKHSIVL